MIAMSASRRESEKERGTGTSWMVRSGIARVSAPEARREEGRAETVRRADPHRAGKRRSALPTSGARREHLRLHALGRGHEVLACRREIAAIGAADDKRDLSEASSADSRLATVAWLSRAGAQADRICPARATARKIRTSSQFIAAAIVAMSLAFQVFPRPES